MQRKVVGPAGVLSTPAEIFEQLSSAAGNEWEVAAAQSLLDDYISRDLTEKGAAARLQVSLTERVKLAQAIVSIANNGILTKEDRQKEDIRAQQSIDIENVSSASKISISQSEVGPEGSPETASKVAGLLEHQAMSVRMEKYVEESGTQVPEWWLSEKSFRSEKVAKVLSDDFKMSREEFEAECKKTPILEQMLYLAVIQSRRQDPGLARLLAERASNSAIFAGSTDSADAGVQKTFKKMGLDRSKEGSHEVRSSHSMPANALEFILLPRHLYAFNTLLRAHIKNDLTLHYVDGTHKVGVSWVPMVGYPQVSFDIESPDWKKELEEILQKERRIFAHVTRPLDVPHPPPSLPSQFMTSKTMKPLSPSDLLLASKVMGKRRAANLSSIGML